MCCGVQRSTVSSEGTITTNPTSDIEANPASVGLAGEVECFSGKYLVPMFLSAKQRLEPTEKMTPTIEAGTLKRREISRLCSHNNGWYHDVADASSLMP